MYTRYRAIRRVVALNCDFETVGAYEAIRILRRAGVKYLCTAIQLFYKVEKNILYFSKVFYGNRRLHIIP